MLIGAGRDAEPGVVGEVQEPARTFGVGKGVADFGGKDRLVADQRHCGRQTRRLQRAPPGAGREPARRLNELGHAGPIPKSLEWDILAEGHEVLLVVALAKKAVATDDLDGVVVFWIAPHPGLDPRRAGDEGRTGAEQRGDVAQRLRVPRQNERERRLRPYEMRHAAPVEPLERAVPRGQLEIAPHDGVLVLRRKGLALVRCRVASAGAGRRARSRSLARPAGRRRIRRSRATRGRRRPSAPARRPVRARASRAQRRSQR